LESYLQRLEQLKVEPNFWCSVEYAEKAGLCGCEILTMSGVTYSVVDQAEGWDVFPPLHVSPDGVDWIRLCRYPPHNRIWSDFPGFPGEEMGYTPHFLDYEYIYDPRDFLTMEGGKWMTFRKNSRKWQRRNPPGYFYVDAREGGLTSTELEVLLVDWLGTLGDTDEVHDDEVMLKYLLEGVNRKALYRESDRKLMGVNIWDSNYMFINFRYSICRPEPFLAEFMRLLFYTDMGLHTEGKLVNDGGVLDRYSLKQFKDRMNPVRVRMVRSWKGPE